MRRFFLVFLLVIAVPVVVLGVAVTVGYRRFTVNLAETRINQTLSQLTQSIDEELRRTTLLTATLSTDVHFSEYVQRYARSRSSRESYEASKVLEDRLSAFFNYSDKTGAVALYMRGLPVFLYRNNGPTELHSDPRRSGQLQPERHATTAPESGRVPERRGFAARLRSPRGRFPRPLPGRHHRLWIYRLQRGADPRERTVSCHPVHLGRTRGHHAGAALLSPAVLKRGGNTFLISQSTVPSTRWTLVAITNYSRVAKDIESFASVARVVLIALFLLFSFYMEIFFPAGDTPHQDGDPRDGAREKGDWAVAVRENSVTV